MVLVFPGTFCSVQHALASSQTALMQRAQSTDNITPSPDKLFLELLSYAYVNGPLAQHQLPLLHTPQDEGKGPSSEQEAECVQLPYLCRLQNGSASHKQLTLRKGWIFCALSLSLSPLEPDVCVFSWQLGIMHCFLPWVVLTCILALATLMLYSTLQHNLNT